MKHSPLNKNNVFAYIVLALSCLNLISQYNGGRYLTLIVSVAGIAGAILFFKGHKRSTNLLWFWVAAQAIVISLQKADPVSGMYITDPVLDLRQYAQLSLLAGFRIHGKSSSVSFDFNFIVLLYGYLLRELKTTALEGKKLRVQNIGTHSSLESETYFLIQLNNRVTIDKNDQWLVGTPMSEVLLNGVPVPEILLEADAGLLSSHFLIPKPGIIIKKEGNSATDFNALDGLIVDTRFKSVLV
jgi:hypothetical protein